MRNTLKAILLTTIMTGNAIIGKSYSTEPDEKLNIIFILADDLGFSDVGYMKQKPEIQTPNIDHLAKNGMVFTNANAASPVCSLSNESILTCKYPATLHLTGHIPGTGMKKYVDKMSIE